MEIKTSDKPALLIIDMVKDSFDESRQLPNIPLAKKIIAPINELISVFREQEWPIVFATSAFQEGDFIFKGRMKSYSIVGTTGAEVIDELNRQPEDYWLRKTKLSAFFDTNLNEWLKKQNVTLCALAGITTNFYVVATALDAMSHGFKTVLLEDCTAAETAEMHMQTLNAYRNDSSLRVMDTQKLYKRLTPDNYPTDKINNN